MVRPVVIFLKQQQELQQPEEVEEQQQQHHHHQSNEIKTHNNSDITIWFIIYVVHIFLSYHILNN